MFTIFEAEKDRAALSSAELAELYRLLLMYAQSREGAWLASFDWRSTHWYWSPVMQTADVLGASDYASHDVYLRPAPELTIAEYAPIIAGTAVHELRHLYQRSRMGHLLYALAALPVVRTFTLEADARSTGASADVFFQNL